MTIGTGQVSFSDIATELGVTTANFSLGDNSKKCWKGGLTAYASFPEVKSYGIFLKMMRYISLVIEWRRVEMIIL